MPTDRLIVHYDWVGVSQQYGGFWYNMLNYTTISLDWGIQGWTTNLTVRNFNDLDPSRMYRYDYPFDSLPPDTTPPANVITTVEPRLDYKFNVTWTPVTDSESGLREYRIYQRLNDNNSTDTLIATVFAGYNSSPSQSYVAGPGYDDGNLYQYMVTAVDNAGNEGSGAYTPEGLPAPPIPFAPLGTLLTLSSGLLAYGYHRRKIH